MNPDNRMQKFGEQGEYFRKKRELFQQSFSRVSGGHPIDVDIRSAWQSSPPPFPSSGIVATAPPSALR